MNFIDVCQKPYENINVHMQDIYSIYDIALRALGYTAACEIFQIAKARMVKMYAIENNDDFVKIWNETIPKQ